VSDKDHNEGGTCPSLPPVGDRGQRYEVRFIDGDGEERVMGWTDQADGGPFAQAIRRHPVWHSWRVIDRHVHAFDRR
jgi:hypothetical protein